MKLYIDVIKDSSQYFVSVGTKENEVISFDNTKKGFRVIKQLLIDRQEPDNKEKITDEWDSIIIENKKYLGKEHIKWIDLNEKDWCNGEIWQTVKEGNIDKELNKKINYYSNLIQKHYFELERYEKEMISFETLLSETIKDFTLNL
jgi:hypothetical protein